MKKFLAVLLAVAILGVAGAAFAGEGVVETTVVELSFDKIAEVALKKLAEVSVFSVDVGITSSDVSKDSADVIVKSYAQKELVVTALLPTMSADKAGMVSADLSFDTAYGKKLVSLDLGASLDVAEEVPAGKTTVSFNLKAGYKGTPVYVLSYNKVSDDTNFAAAKTEFTAKESSTGTVSTFVPQEVLDAMSKELGVTVKRIDPADVVGMVSLDKSAVSAASKDALPLLELSSDTAAGTYALSVDVTSLNTTDNEISTLALDLSSDKYVVQTAAGDQMAFWGTDNNLASYLTSRGYVVFQIAGKTAYNPVLIVNKKGTEPEPEPEPEGPTSSKGSGGCNGGFAGIAVLALGLAALRRKAR